MILFIYLVTKPLNLLAYSSDNTDRELLEAIRHDDEKAFAELFKRYWRKVHAMAYSRVRSKEITEEIVQELFTSLWDKRHTHSIKHLPSYLFQAVKFKALNYIESKLVREKYWNYYRTFVSQEENVTELAVEYGELMEAFEDGMKRLPEKTKEVFKLHRMDGWSVPQIANLLNLSEKAIQYHLTQSVKKLRIHLKNYIFFVAVVLEFLVR